MFQKTFGVVTSLTLLRNSHRYLPLPPIHFGHQPLVSSKRNRPVSAYWVRHWFLLIFLNYSLNLPLASLKFSLSSPHIFLIQHPRVSFNLHCRQR